MPAEAGIRLCLKKKWTPACAGVTFELELRRRRKADPHPYSAAIL